ncbi:glycosyltransferase family 4 protein [Tunicatimonas pelagia]|uniref:glycosyltransferase family 4 protein n=1 Tax=Tunicatimonas pelagia TaxID=931531 RepID=UPI00266647ED|nr:glycosyltransferase family 4 protein [Tunicatimonas pelagia]WKN40981.1 glycosyltransferase family 4 protein [Tunicatimonas pelagia]
MNNIVLLSNRLFHYRVPIYNYFHQEFLKEGYNFSVLATEQQPNFDPHFEFECQIESPSFSKYKAIIQEKQPAAVIVFMHLKDRIMWPMIHWLKIQDIPVIYWNHGVNLQDPDNWYKNILYRYLHNLADAIVLYSPAEKQYIKSKNHPKVHIGYNTLNLRSFPTITQSKEELKKEWELPYKKVVLFAASTTLRRRLDLLLDIFDGRTDQEIGLVLAGLRDLPSWVKEVVDRSPAITYVGEISDQVAFNKLVKLSDVFTIPGRSGLAINQAFHWGVPYVTTNVRQSPEVWYLKDGQNGYIADISKEGDYRDKVLHILQDDALRAQMSAKAQEVIQTEGDIHNMYQGFWNAFQFATERKKVKR